MRLTIDLMIFSLPQEYQQIVDAEWEILYDKLDKIVKSGAKVVLSKLPIGDVATQYFADRLDFLLSYFLSEMHPSNTPWSRSILFVLISVCIFSILLSLHFLRSWQRFLHSPDLHVWFRGDNITRNLMLVTPKGQRFTCSRLSQNDHWMQPLNKSCTQSEECGIYLLTIRN